ncbi:sodium-coupled monocarboxylate transporter 2-like [Liolophura sinensis]|uniref:sodium-coupled monocarboxylate transporter 2-like n=1 Tax=Liolophura sinensis TaxID=3198878 RepID=UPI003158B4BD
MAAVSGFPVGYSIVLVSAASVFYTSLGGIKAVIWTDVIQSVIMLGGMLTVVIMGSICVGGFHEMWLLNVNGGRVKFFDFDPNPLTRHTFWSLVFGKAIRSMGMGFNQSTIQRVVSVKTQKQAKIVVWSMFPGFVVFGTLACLEGMVSYAYFSYTGCDPYGAKIISNANQVLPYVVTDLFQNLPGLSGLFLASLFSASLSTLSSALSSISVLVWTDFLQTHMKHASETKATIIAKLVVVVFGLVSVGVAFLIKTIGGPLQQVLHFTLQTLWIASVLNIFAQLDIRLQ